MTQVPLQTSHAIPSMFQWSGFLGWATLLSGVMFVGSIVVAWVLVVRMPVDYFVRDHDAHVNFAGQHPLLRMILVVLKNVIGLGLFAVGVIMLLTPGQGILFMFLGVTLIDFPRKKELLHKVLHHEKLLNLLDKIRRKAGKPPLTRPPSENETTTDP